MIIGVSIEKNRLLILINGLMSIENNIAPIGYFFLTSLGPLEVIGNLGTH